MTEALWANGGAVVLAVALVLDAWLGEPDWLWSRLPHPAVVMGRAVGWVDAAFNKGRHRKPKGIAAMGALAAGAGALGIAIGALPGAFWIELILAAILLAQRSLADHVSDVASALRRSLPEGRRSVGRIVGRDTSAMDGPAVTRGAIESAAENLSDGVIAPAFWFLIGGLPGMLIYKVTNTADSMIGYRTERYAAFGWAAARLDDVLNWIPARLTAVLIWLVHGGRGAWPAMIRDARQHRSPNAGWPEAAMAAALNVALSGPRSYDRQRRDFPFVHPHGNSMPGPDEIDRAVRALWRTWAAAVVSVIVIGVV